ncbi:MAG: RDD family protein [Qingshengfaniella sp.]
MTDYDTALWGLPNPDTHGEFYTDVPFKRFLAWIVDSLMILLITLGIVMMTLFIGFAIFPLIWLGVSLIYRIITVSRHSATPGMRLMAIELRTHRGARFDLTTTVLHNLLYTFMLATMLFQVVSIILMLTTARRQGLHDLLLGTAAINRASAS